MALLFAAEHAQRASERALHFHGGYGFMQEYDIQLYYRRAKGWPLVLDSVPRELERLGARRYGGGRPGPLAGARPPGPPRRGSGPESPATHRTRWPPGAAPPGQS